MNHLSQIPLSPQGGFKGQGAIGLSGQNPNAISIFTKILSATIGLLTVVVFIWFVIKLIIGAIGIITAGGDKGKLESARNGIVIGILGVVVVIAAIFLVDLFGYLFGIPDILNPAQWVSFLEIK